MPFTLFNPAEVEKTVNTKKNTLLIREKLLIDENELLAPTALHFAT
jgi:hypothetical protein